MSNTFWVYPNWLRTSNHKLSSTLHSTFNAIDQMDCTNQNCASFHSKMATGRIWWIPVPVLPLASCAVLSKSFYFFSQMKKLSRIFLSLYFTYKCMMLISKTNPNEDNSVQIATHLLWWVEPRAQNTQKQKKPDWEFVYLLWSNRYVATRNEFMCPFSSCLVQNHQ